MPEEITKIPSRLKNSSIGGHVAGAKDIIDDTLNKELSQINQEWLLANQELTLDIANRYTKNEVNNLISRTPETDIVIIDIPTASQSNIAAWLNANTPNDINPDTGKSVRANKLYRVPGSDNHSYSEWGWNGTSYIMLANKDYGINRSVISGSDNTVTSDAVSKSDTRNIFYCINTKDAKICYCDGNYTINSKDISSTASFLNNTSFLQNISVVNAKNAILACNEDFTVDVNAIENDTTNPFFNAIKDRYTIDRDSERFLGFPMCIVYDDIIYVFYRVAEGHASTPGVEQDNYYYKWSSDGINWSERLSIQFNRSTVEGHPYDYRGVFPFKYEGNLYCLFLIATSYKDDNDEWKIGAYIAGAAKLIKNPDNTLTIVREKLFPSFNIRNGIIDFNKTFGDNGYIGTVVGGLVLVKDDYAYFPVYYFNTHTGVLKWKINDNLEFNELNFLTVAIMNGGSAYPNEATIWFDADNVLKALIRWEYPNNSRIYTIDEELRLFTRLAFIGNCQGPSNIKINDNKVVIAGRNYKKYSNIILWDDIHNKVLSSDNEYDSPGFDLGWTDSFYGCFCVFRGVYYHFFYKRLDENTTTICFVTFTDIAINNIDNYNKGKDNMGTLVKNNSIINNGNMKFAIPCCAAVDCTKRINFYKPTFHNTNAPSLRGLMLASISMDINLTTDENSYLKFSIKNESEGIAIIIENEFNEGESPKIIISYINGAYKYQKRRIFTGITSGAISLTPSIVANTLNNKVIADLLQIERSSMLWISEEVDNPEININDYPDGIHILNSGNCRIGMTGASVNNVPIFSFVSTNPEEKNIDLVSKIIIQGNKTFHDLNQDIPYLNNWFLTAADKVQD